MSTQIEMRTFQVYSQDNFLGLVRARGLNTAEKRATSKYGDWTEIREINYPLTSDFHSVRIDI